MQKVLLKLRGVNQVFNSEVNDQGTVFIQEASYQLDTLPVDVPIAGTVYGTLLNFQGAYDALAPSIEEVPYSKPPKAPILYIKPKNTFIASGQAIPLPQNLDELEMGASLGLVIGKTATKVKRDEALAYVFGYTIVNDVSIPHDNVHRPAVKEKARDGFCPIGPWIMNKDTIKNPNNLKLTVSINGEIKQENSTKNLIRSIETLLADVTEFMTLYKGDVLLIGVPEKAPLAKENDLVKVEIEGIGSIENRVMKEQDALGGDAV